MTSEASGFPSMNIGAVERDTGLSKDILRVWERRYGFPAPERDSGGERFYSMAQVEKLRLVKRLIDQGFRPGKLISVATEELKALLERRPSAIAEDKPPLGTASGQHRVLDLLKLQRVDETRAELGQMLLKLGLQRFVIEAIAPLSAMVGDAWSRGEIQVHEEHVYTEQVQNLLRGAINAQPAGVRRPKVMLTTFPEEEHGLGLLMVEAILVSEGAQCVSLGTRTPLTDIHDAALSGQFDVIALSFSASYPQRQAIAGLQALRSAVPARIALWAGGAGVRDKSRQLTGVQVAGPVSDTLTALADWRRDHGA